MPSTWPINGGYHHLYNDEPSRGCGGGALGTVAVGNLLVPSVSVTLHKVYILLLVSETTRTTLNV